MSLDITLRYSKKVRDQLIWMKRQTGLPHYHTLCRWAFCLSMADPTRPKQLQIGGDARERRGKSIGEEAATFELPWERFGQRDAEILGLILKRRLLTENTESTRENLQHAAQAHIQRGMSRLMAGKKIRSIADLAKLATHHFDSETADEGRSGANSNTPN